MIIVDPTVVQSPEHTQIHACTDHSSIRKHTYASVTNVGKVLRLPVFVWPVLDNLTIGRLFSSSRPGAYPEIGEEPPAMQVPTACRRQMARLLLRLSVVLLPLNQAWAEVS